MYYSLFKTEISQKPLNQIAQRCFLFTRATIVFVALNLTFSLPLPAMSAELFEDVFLSERNSRKILFLTADSVRALELSKLEANRRNVNFKSIAHYSIDFQKDYFIVFLSPEYAGGLDGPEFRVVISRSSWEIISVINTLTE